MTKNDDHKTRELLMSGININISIMAKQYTKQKTTHS